MGKIGELCSHSEFSANMNGGSGVTILAPGAIAPPGNQADSEELDDRTEDWERVRS